MDSFEDTDVDDVVVSLVELAKNVFSSDTCLITMNFFLFYDAPP